MNGKLFTLRGLQTKSLGGMSIKAHSGESVPMLKMVGAEAVVQILGSLGALMSGLVSCRKRRPALL